eukprot:TRINITY_DN22498_c0_g1_i1.p1 TRINITY_DN22498_c0_g1~~TRINITY_DN22498_c0_g1_i1.p1  ORF type:complete len:420 (+),score=25.42 TRINITY_DN22498_c0_g1_i1:62-1321(+)
MKVSHVPLLLSFATRGLCIAGFIRKETSEDPLHTDNDYISVIRHSTKLRVSLGKQEPRRYLLVSADTDPWPTNVTSMTSAKYSVLKTVANYIYAQHNGYEYVRYVYTDASSSIENACNHPFAGPRHAAWCKLLAVAIATSDLGKHISSFAGTFWLDTDMHIATLKYSLDDFLDGAKEGSECQLLVGNNMSDTHEWLERSHVITAKEWGGCNGPFLTAMWFLRNSKEGHDILREWWNIVGCTAAFPWEQRALESYGLNVQDKRMSGLAVFDVDTHHFRGTEILNDFTVSVPSQDNFTFRNMFVHDGHSAQHVEMRAIRVRRTLSDWGITEEAFQRAIDAIRQRHIRTLSRVQLDQIGRSLYDESLAFKYDKLIKAYERVGPAGKSKLPGCRWVPVGHCDPDNKRSRKEGCDTVGSLEPAI